MNKELEFVKEELRYMGNINCKRRSIIKKAEENGLNRTEEKNILDYLIHDYRFNPNGVLVIENMPLSKDALRLKDDKSLS
ncbi:hypothetical protein HQ703_09240 [Enterococcus faecium]|nr:hypothetical protein [Enterococcus faecium]